MAITRDRLIEVIAIVVTALIAITSPLVSYFAVKSSNATATSNNKAALDSTKEANDRALDTARSELAGSVRSEITGYATEMVRLDRAADERNGTQITVLGEQANALINQYQQQNLNLAPATYRVLAEITDLDTENRRLAKSFGDTAVRLAHDQEDTIEEIRARRALADLGAQDGDVTLLKGQVSQAIHDARSSKSGIVRKTEGFTGSFAVYSALLTSFEGGGSDACQLARDYFADYGDDIHSYAKKTQSLEVSRRAYRLRTHENDEDICGLSPRKDLFLDDFEQIWLNNPERR